MEENCIFCKIVEGEIPCAKIWENDRYLAFLDLNPNTEGMTLVIPKEHYDSYLFDAPEDIVKEICMASQIVSKKLQKYYDIDRVGIVAEGMGVNHLHIKLYPMHGVKGDFQVMEAPEKVYFDKYEGYLCTKMGHQANSEELNSLAEKIRAVEI